MRGSDDRWTLRWLVTMPLVMVLLGLWIIPEGLSWWRSERPDLKRRDQARLADLDRLEQGLTAYARRYHHFPNPRDYGNDDGDNWDSSTRGTFLEPLTEFMPVVPRDPLNRATGDPCHGPRNFGYAYSRITGHAADDEAYILCTHLERTGKTVERRRRLGDTQTGATSVDDGSGFPSPTRDSSQERPRRPRAGRWAMAKEVYPGGLR